MRFCAIIMFRKKEGPQSIVQIDFDEKFYWNVVRPDFHGHLVYFNASKKKKNPRLVLFCPGLI